MLPNGSEPLVLADGTRIDPMNGSVVLDEILVEVPNTEEIKKEIVAARKRISDLPVPPSQMNTLSIILSYSLFGLSDNDISFVTALSSDEIESIKISDVYIELRKTLVQNILNSDANDVRGLFVQHSQAAAGVMFNAMIDQANGVGTRMAAAKDVLDRAGHRPADVIEHKHSLEGGLTIEYIDNKDEIPTIDITPKDY
jgi:hypothetical protein|tara:strand:- start:1956 stop:2549 length:594 start_codon:yes stop_codon:yes gene_type:complete